MLADRVDRAANKRPVPVCEPHGIDLMVISGVKSLDHGKVVGAGDIRTGHVVMRRDRLPGSTGHQFFQMGEYDTAFEELCHDFLPEHELGHILFHALDFLDRDIRVIVGREMERFKLRIVLLAVVEIPEPSFPVRRRTEPPTPFFLCK